MKIYLIEYDLSQRMTLKICVPQYSSMKIGIKGGNSISLFDGQTLLPKDDADYKGYKVFNYNSDGDESRNLIAVIDGVSLNLIVCSKASHQSELSSGGGGEQVWSKDSLLSSVQLEESLKDYFVKTANLSANELVCNEATVKGQISANGQIYGEDTVVRDLSSLNIIATGGLFLGNGLVTQSSLMAGSVQSLGSIKVSQGSVSAPNISATQHLYVNGKELKSQEWSISAVTTLTSLSVGNTVYNIGALTESNQIIVDPLNIGDQIILRFNGYQEQNITVAFSGYGLVDMIESMPMRQFISEEPWITINFLKKAILKFTKYGAGWTYLEGWYVF